MVSPDKKGEVTHGSSTVHTTLVVVHPSVHTTSNFTDKTQTLVPQRK